MANMFDENGKYNKTEWKPGDRITAVKLNKIEESLEAINNNDIERHKEADERLDALEEQNESVEERFDELEDLVADKKSEVEALIYENNVKMDRLEMKLDDGIDTVEAMVTSIRPKITEIQNDVTEIQNDVTEIQSNIGAQISELQVQSRNANAFMDQFEVSHVNKNGYYVLPGGLMLQWGTMSTYFDDASSMLGEHAFNVPFKNDVYNLFIDTNNFGADANGEAVSVDIYSIVYHYTVSSFKYEIKTLSGATPSGTVYFSWFAIGM